MAALRSTMSQIISRVRLMIQDPAGPNEVFADQDIQDTCDECVDFVRYEPLKIAPTILNAASTSNTPVTIFADYFSDFKWWESDVVLQGNNVSTLQSWVVLTPVFSDYINGHWQFESNIFTSGTAPGQYPPVFATGKVYDLNWAAANLLEYWAATYARRFDFTSDGQSFKVSQARDGLMQQATYYRRQAKPKVAKMERKDMVAPMSTRGIPLLDSGDEVR